MRQGGEGPLRGVIAIEHPNVVVAQFVEVLEEHLVLTDNLEKQSTTST
ncbi:MAG: hypothetical protein RKP46_07845 [Candidatus Accumulibacter sp.]|nr:hypothetical protein [Accumulibacter sp.]MDS4014257.1 hypothetical protein [Accumulibacter sp.]